MAVKTKKIIEFSDGQKEAIVYLPSNYILTKEEKEKADKIDKIIEEEIKKINREFQYSTDSSIKKNSLLKWKWLSKRLKKLIHFLQKNGLKDKDLRDNIVWIPIRQYLCEELSSGSGKREGTHKDHYRKVYLLSKIKGLKWINSWAGWDAFADRGDAILQYPEIFSELEKRFSSVTKDLSGKDYQFIAKQLIKYTPMFGEKRKSLSSLSSDKLSLIAQKVFEDYEGYRNKKVQKSYPNRK